MAKRSRPRPHGGRGGGRGAGRGGGAGGPPPPRPGALSARHRGRGGGSHTAVAVAIAETEPGLTRGREPLFRAAELLFAGLFFLEFLARLWTAPERAPGAPPWRARLRWLASPPALADLLALLPALLMLAGAPSFVLRLLRLLRILRLANLGPASVALELVVRTVLSRRHELSVTLALGAVILVLSSTLLHLLEGAAQPEAFGSIPRALWWGVVTLTTIGYGDVYPVTAGGRLVAGLTAVSSIGLVAAPAGILAAAFADALRAPTTPPAGPHP
ncbi:potassium channel family protein [Phenylobacterium sp.]|uniref:potassium channel family protein n=1 Tax=Phenylobacterium sp. TaxID=1871053 RepID=UPI0035AE8926